MVTVVTIARFREQRRRTLSGMTPTARRTRAEAVAWLVGRLRCEQLLADLQPRRRQARRHRGRRRRPAAAPPSPNRPAAPPPPRVAGARRRRRDPARCARARPRRPPSALGVGVTTVARRRSPPPAPGHGQVAPEGAVVAAVAADRRGRRLRRGRRARDTGTTSADAPRRSTPSPISAVHAAHAAEPGTQRGGDVVDQPRRRPRRGTTASRAGRGTPARCSGGRTATNTPARRRNRMSGIVRVVAACASSRPGNACTAVAHAARRSSASRTCATASRR